MLGRRPDVVTPNGFEKDFVPKGTKFAAARKAARKHMLDVASALTGVEYSADTFLLATSGRCEYRNKGIDLFLDAVDRLGNLDPVRPVLAFVMVPAWCGGPRQDLAHQLDLGQKTRLGDPFISHTLNNYDSDPIIQRIHGLGFANDGGSRVSVIYVPCYLNGTDGIFDMTYYQLLPGLDATVFPSYYEPWGYTPLESVAFGVPTITTGLSGFGQWVLDNFENSFEACGVRVEKRGDSDYDHVRDAIARDLKSLISDSVAQAAQFSQAAMATAAAASWTNFITDYEKAYCIAMSSAAQRIPASATATTPKRCGRTKKA